jgi:hypothetical protein
LSHRESTSDRGRNLVFLRFVGFSDYLIPVVR